MKVRFQISQKEHESEIGCECWIEVGIKWNYL